MPKTDPRVDAYIAAAPAFAQPILHALRDRIHAACPEATEAIKWGMPMFLYRGQIMANIAAFKAHEAVEDAYLSRIVRQLGLEPELDAAIAEGHRSLGTMAHLFGTVVRVCDGEHVYRVRTVLSLLSEELERHFSYEEKQVFPKLRDRLPEGLLRELGHRARALQHVG